MQQPDIIENDFINSITEVISRHISDEKFGVSELAQEIGMSRSNLLRKVKALTGISVSQFIRQVRLKKAMELLRQSSFTVSEVSFKVGFSSSSYFIKCFRDYYGYPPGEAGNRKTNNHHTAKPFHKIQRRFVLLPGIVLVLLITAVTFFIFVC